MLSLFSKILFWIFDVELNEVNFSTFNCKMNLKPPSQKNTHLTFSTPSVPEYLTHFLKKKCPKITESFQFSIQLSSLPIQYNSN